MTPLGKLLAMLTYRRPMGSETESRFTRRFIEPATEFRDDHGNYHAYRALPNGSPSRVVWSCHTDTVHRTPGFQTLRYDHVTGVIGLSKRARQFGSNCLGADDTAGCFALLELLAANVPGHYIFHFGEERGGIGSGNLARDTPEYLRDAEIAIALDRRGSGDVITSQYGGICCSDAFAASLSAELSRLDPRLVYRPNAGSYTDTAEYMDLVPECTNLSIGYAREHSTDETLDTRHLFRLCAALATFDETRLTVARDPRADNSLDPWDHWIQRNSVLPLWGETPGTVVAADTLCVCGHILAEHAGISGGYGCCLCDCGAFEDLDEGLYLSDEMTAVQRALREYQSQLDQQVQTAKRRKVGH